MSVPQANSPEATCARALRAEVLEILNLQVKVQLPQGMQSVSMRQALVLCLAARQADQDAERDEETA